MLKIASWNVNGLRSVIKKKSLDWILNFDIVGIQEAKLSEQLDNDLMGFNTYYSLGQKPGYSGVCIFSKIKPQKIENTFTNIGYQDLEGRIIKAFYEDFVLYNIYFPNGKKNDERLNFKINFYQNFIQELSLELKNNKRIIVMGDFNTAHQEIDLARPKENTNVSGFMKEERELIDEIIAQGFIDTFRKFNNEPNWYTWWHLLTKARSRNVGWRIDYIIASSAIETYVKKADILKEITGSDHCPVSIDLSF